MPNIAKLNARQIHVSLPLTGKSRWSSLQYFIPVSDETWRKLIKQKKAPQPLRLSTRCTIWDNSEIHAWLADPAGYRAPQSTISDATETHSVSGNDQ